MRRPPAAVLLVCLTLLAAVSDAAAQPYAYVVGQRDDDPGPGTGGQQTLVVIDTATNQRVAAIPVGRTYCWCQIPNGVAIRPDGSRVYVASVPDGTVSVIAEPSHAVVATVQTGNPVASVAVSPDGARYFVSGGNAIHVFSAVTDTVVQTIALGTQTYATGSTIVAPDGRRLYVSASSGPNHMVAVVDLLAGAVERTLRLEYPQGFSLTPDGRLLYVRDNVTLAPSVTVVDTSTLHVVATLPADTFTWNTAVHPGGARVYLGGNPMKVISTANHAVLDTLTGRSARQLAITPDGRRVYGTGTVFGGTPSTILVLDASTNALVTSIPWDDAAHGKPGPIAIASPPRPLAPTGLQSLVYGTSVRLWWTPPAGVPPQVSYVVEAGAYPGDVLVRLPVSGPAFSVVAPPGTWYVRVRSVVWGVESLPSAEVQLVVNPSAPPSPPTGLLGLASGSSIALAWKNPESGGTPSGLLLDVTGAITTALPLPMGESFTYDGVPPGTYTFSVRAMNAGGTSAPSNAVALSFPSTCSGPPQAPPNMAISIAGRHVSVSWDLPAAGPAPTGYSLQVTGALQLTIPLQSRVASGAVPPGTYHIAAAATNACGTGPSAPVQTIVVP